MPASPPDPAAAAAPDRHFLGWDRPLLGQVINYLAGSWRGGVLDLSDRLVVVPTRQSGRRLREALAERAASRGTGVFPPRVVTPEAMMSLVRPEGQPVATTQASLLVWTAVLKDVRLEEFPALFPRVPPRLDFAWALRLAGAWQRVRQSLGEGGISIDRAAAQLAADGHPEAVRWSELARLEGMYLRRIAAGGFVDAQVARSQAAAAPVCPVGVRRIEFAAVSDPLDLAVAAAARLLRQGVEVAVLVGAPADRAAMFDAWGRPEPEAWRSARDLPLPLDWCHPAAGPLEQATAVTRLAAGHRDPAATLSLGVTDPEVAEVLAVAPSEVGERTGSSALVCHRPDGRPAGMHEIWHVLDGAVRLLNERSFRALGQWLRLPPVAAELRRRARFNSPVSYSRLLRAWDRFANSHLPQSLSDGHAFHDPIVNALTAAADEILAEQDQPPCSRAVAGLLAAVYAGRSFPQTTPDGAAFHALARALSESLQHAEAAVTLARVSPTPGELIAFVLDELRELRLDVEDRPPGAVDLNGWLELPWEDAPHLIVAGANDGMLPEVILGDPYLPESLRERFGLRRTNAARLARDAHQLHALIASRASLGGRVDLVFGRTSEAGEALRPSRLLFLRPDDELPGRARALFGGDRVPDPPPQPARRSAWRLRIPPPVTLERVSVTALRDYLACPFRFFLKHGLRMEEVDAEPRELDARAFGILCHGALKSLAVDPAMERCDDEAVIAGFLQARLRQALGESHGKSLTVPLRVQLASAEKRLAAFAGWQAQSVRSGWRTIHTEFAFEDLLGEPWRLGDLEIRGVIDRIDARGDERRIIDYKTHDSPNGVVEAHLGRPVSAVRLAQGWPEWQLHRGEESQVFLWQDLQLPIYALVARQAWGGHPEAGYFHLAKAVDDCAYEPWSALTPEVLLAAETCARGVTAAIRNNDFWPPREPGRFDAFGWLLADGAAAAVDPSALISS